MEFVRRFRFKDKGNGRVSRMDMSIHRVNDWVLNGEGSVYFENSRTASVVSGVFSFFTSNIFLGGEGHRRDKRSLPVVSASVSTDTISCNWRH